MAKRNLKAIVITLVAVAAIAIVSAITTIFSGAYDVTATKQHTAPVYWTLDTAVRQAIKHGARDISAPSLDSPDMIRRGLSLYRDSCAQCHGAPGVAPAPFSHGMMPLPNSLAQTARQWKAEEVYWVTRNGLKMTGMPAWRFRYPDADLWAIVAFVMNMPSLTARDYATMASVQHGPVEILWKETMTTGDARRGELALQQYACTTCHRIPGIVGAIAHVGPPLDGIARRKYLAGRLPMSRDNLVQWIRAPQAVKPQTLMPDLGVTQAHAVDMAAYLLAMD